MKLTPKPNNPEEGWYHLLSSEEGKVQMAIYPVMFGWRIRAWFTGRQACMLDWCAGADWSHVEWLYTALRLILEAREETSQIFEDLPSHSEIKPVFADKEFMLKVASILAAIGQGEKVIVQQLPIPDTKFPVRNNVDLARALTTFRE